MATSGQRDKRVTIQQRTETASASGNPTSTWTELARVDMNRLDSIGREGLGGSQVAAEFNTEWHMPYLSTMDPDKLPIGVDVPKNRRLVYAGRVHDIKAAIREPLPKGGGIILHTIASSKP